MKRTLITMIASLLTMGTTAMAQAVPVPGTDGNKYVPYEERTGNESIVYFTRNLSAEGLIRAYEQVCANIGGKVGVKLHTGEQHGPNIIPHEWVRELLQKDLPDAHIVETNKLYTKVHITITEGKNRQVRRMFEAIGKNVEFLKRIRLGDLTVSGLDRGEVRPLTEEEVAYLKNL